MDQDYKNPVGDPGNKARSHHRHHHQQRPHVHVVQLVPGHMGKENRMRSALLPHWEARFSILGPWRQEWVK